MAASLHLRPRHVAARPRHVAARPRHVGARQGLSRPRHGLQPSSRRPGGAPRTAPDGAPPRLAARAVGKAAALRWTPSTARVPLRAARARAVSEALGWAPRTALGPSKRAPSCRATQAMWHVHATSSSRAGTRPRSMLSLPVSRRAPRRRSSSEEAPPLDCTGSVRR